MTPEQKNARIKRLVSAARALLSLQVGLYVGARRIDHVLDSLGADFKAQHPIFSDFTQAVPLDTPVGSARLMWNPEALLRTDATLASVEARFRTQLLAECIEIIGQYR